MPSFINVLNVLCAVLLVVSMAKMQAGAQFFVPTFDHDWDAGEILDISPYPFRGCPWRELRCTSHCREMGFATGVCKGLYKMICECS